MLQRQDVSEALLDPLNFKTFWINFADNSLTLGWGMVHPSGHLLNHPVHVPAQRLFIGFLSLDSPVVFRSIRLKRHLGSPLSVMPSPSGSLASHCLDALANDLAPESICQLLCLLTAMWRTADPAWIRCVAYLAEHFAAVADAAPDAMCTLPAEAVSEALASSRLNAPEITIFCAIEAWALGSSVSLDAPPTRAGAPPAAARLAQCLPEITQVLEHIRFPLMSCSQLQRVHASPLWGLIGTPCAYLPDDGRPQQQAGTGSDHGGSLGPPRGHVQGPARQRRAQVCLPQDLRRMWRHQRRAPANATELQFVHTRDKNGVLYHLGTNAGLNARFVNPHLTGVVQVVSSSLYCSASHAGKLTSRVYHGDQCAHPNSAGETFWQVDLKRHTVVCLEYVLRVNDSGAVPRGWVLQGANDAATWTDLHRVSDSTFFQSKGQYGVWRVEQPVMRPFSSIRLLLVGAASNGSPVLNVNFIDLYGYLMTNRAAQ